MTVRTLDLAGLPEHVDLMGSVAPGLALNAPCYVDQDRLFGGTYGFPGGADIGWDFLPDEVEREYAVSVSGTAGLDTPGAALTATLAIFDADFWLLGEWLDLNLVYGQPPVPFTLEAPPGAEIGHMAFSRYDDDYVELDFVASFSWITLPPAGPVARLHPRDDGRGPLGGPRRLTPGGSSRQSGRLSGGYL